MLQIHICDIERGPPVPVARGDFLLSIIAAIFHKLLKNSGVGGVKAIGLRSFRRDLLCLRGFKNNTADFDIHIHRDIVKL